MRHRWVWLATLGSIGTASLLYGMVIGNLLQPTTESTLAWLMLGVLPLLALGVWLLAASSSLTALHVLLVGTGLALSEAYVTFLYTNPGVASQPWFPLFNLIGLTADALAGAAFMAMIAGYPTGTPERSWQRGLMPLVWLQLLHGPLTLLTTPTVVLPRYASVPGEPLGNPYALPWLEWAAVGVDRVFGESTLAFAIGMVVFLSRALFGSPDTREKLRIILWLALGITIAWLAFSAWPHLWVTSVVMMAMLLAFPVAFMYGILRHGAFDVALSDRGHVVLRSSSLLITLYYGLAVAAPAILLSDRFDALTLGLLTAATAVLLLPLRGVLQRGIQRAVLGDRDRQLALLTDLAGRLERAVDPRLLPTRLAEAVQAGLQATWVRVRLADADGALSAAPLGVAGQPGGEASVTHDLADAERGLVGVIELGPRERGDYGEAERALLRTVATQATTAIANVRLSAQLDEQLAELTASRERLVAAQDDERRRLERNVHDGVQQTVVALIAGLRLARNRLVRGELTPAELDDLQDQAKETLSDLRELAHGIHPPVLSDNGLVAALESGVTRFPIPLTVSADPELRSGRLPDDVETTAYYVVREALANVAKHAGAARADVRLERVDDHLHIAVSDDGRGLARAVRSERGGLANIADRVAALRGRVDVGANRPRGTVVAVDLPLHDEWGPSHGD